MSEYWKATEAKKRITQKKVSESSGKFWNGRKKQRNGNKFHRLLLSFLSPLSRRVRTNAAKMHHAVQAWCKVSMSGRFAKSAPSVRSAGGAFCRFPVPLCICPPLPLSRCVGTNSVKMYCACSVRVQLPLSAKFKYCFINCSLYFADNVLYYPCAESEGSL